MQGQVRIIGGQWRGRKLKVPNVHHLRPTPDRVRETLFNWLAPVIQGAVCLDAFAGSGALGFEALSRGAGSVVMIDQSREIVKLLQEEARILQTQSVEIYQAQLPEQLKKTTQLFDIVFLDPPYQSDLLIPMCFTLEDNGYLADSAMIYMEAKSSLTAEDLPKNWHIIKSKVAGQVAYHLVRRMI